MNHRGMVPPGFVHARRAGVYAGPVIAGPGVARCRLPDAALDLVLARQFEADVLKGPAPLAIIGEFAENALIVEVFSG